MDIRFALTMLIVLAGSKSRTKALLSKSSRIDISSVVAPSQIHRILRTQLHTSSSSSHVTLESGSHEAEYEVKKSRFLGYAQHVESGKEAQDYLQYVRSIHPKARHVCFGYLAGTNPVEERCSDDGEPAGTAGAPILGAIKGEDLSDCVCVVVRYFGGIKLGAGGLIRAYGTGARQVLRDAPRKILIPKSIFRVKVGAPMIGAIYESVRKAGGTTSEEEYDEQGELSVSVTCETEQYTRLCKMLVDATRGEVIFVSET